MADKLNGRSVSRRGLLKGAAATAGMVTAGAGVLSSVKHAGASHWGGRGGGGGGARNPLYIPPVVSPGNFQISAADGQVDIGGGRLTGGMFYNDSMPGPTFVATKGATADITLTNNLAEDTTIHWHGMVVTSTNDGIPQYPVAPGETYRYNFPIVQRACMNWYHPHAHHLTGSQVAYGLAGGFLIRDAEEDSLGLPSGAYEVPLVLRDCEFDSLGNLSFSNRDRGFEGNTPLVNGTIDPTLSVETAVYRFRMLIGTNARIFRLALNDGTPFTLIGNDGGLLETATQLAEMAGSPGERFDVLVDFRNRLVGDKVMLVDLDSGWDLLEFSVDAISNNPGTIPTGQLSTIEKLSNPVTVREFSFDGKDSINGQQFDLWRIDFQAPRGEVELWRFTTGWRAPHPVHVHGASFQVVSRTGGRGQLYPWEGGWKDVVLMEDNETIEVLIRFDDHEADGFVYPSTHVMHCHKLSHEDAGMMLNFQVI